MGSYTKLNFKCKLKQDVPKEVTDILERVINQGDLGHDKVMFNNEDVFHPDIEHSFFKCSRWYMLFLSKNFDYELEGSKFYKDKGNWILSIETEFKNYDNEIENFLDWITPFIVGRKKSQYVGYWKHEEMEQRFNLYVER